MWTLGLVLERHHFLARFRHQTLRHHVRVVCGYRLHLRYQVGENGAFGRRQGQVAHPAQIELAHATRNVVVHVVLDDARRPAHGRVPLEGARVVVVGVQVVLARPSGQRVEAAVQRIHVVHRRGPEEVDLLSLSGDLGRRHRDRDEGQVVRGLGPVVAVHHHELRRLVWVVLQLLVLLVLLQVMLAGGELLLLLLLHLVLHPESPQPRHQLRLDETEAHRDHSHAEEDVARGDVLRGCSLGLQVPGAYRAEGGEAEVERLEDGPALDLVEEDGAQGDVADEDEDAEGNRHGWRGRRHGRRERRGGGGRTASMAAATATTTITYIIIYKAPRVLLVVLLELFVGLVRVHVIPVCALLHLQLLLLRAGVAVFLGLFGRPAAAAAALAVRGYP